MPAQLPCGRIERHDRIGVQVVAFAFVTVVIRAWVARGPEKLVGFGVVSARQPSRRAAMLQRFAYPGFRQWLAWRGNRPEAPDVLAGLGFIGREEAADAVIATRSAGEHQVVDD